MSLVTGVVLPNNGDRIKAENYNDPINKILAQVNGNLDDSNITGLNGSKIAPGSITQDKLSTALNFAGWASLGATPTAVTANGNRSYDLTFAADQSSVLSPGMRLRTTRTVAAPTQSTSLNGTSQYYSKATPAGMTFTDDFAGGAWVKLTSYPSTDAAIEGRYNGTSGWHLVIKNTGQVQIAGLNGGAGNYSLAVSYQSLPLNKWVHVAAQLDMSAFTATSTTSYIMIDGVDVPVSVARGGTNPTSLVQAGDFQIGAANGASFFFPGKIAQAAIFSAKVTQATMRGYMAQGLTGTETSLISAYSFNGVTTDLNTTNANNLTANGSAVATNADSPFGGQSNDTISSTLDYAIVQKTGSTVVVQVPEGCTIPTSGGLASVSYSPHRSPYGFPSQRLKWRYESIIGTILSTTVPATTWTNISAWKITVPVGSYILGAELMFQVNPSPAASADIRATLSTSPTTESEKHFAAGVTSAVATSGMSGILVRSKNINTTAETSYYVNYWSTHVAVGYIRGDYNAATVYVDNAYL